MADTTHRPTIVDSDRTQRALALTLPTLLAVLASLIVVRLLLIGGPDLNNDSYQYLNVAGNISAEKDLVTSIVHFDAERATGKIPAPSVSFPGGYPLLIWSGALVIGGAWAGQAISAFAVIGIAWLIWRYATRLGLSLAVRSGVTLAWVASSQVIEFGTRVQSEALFTVLLFGTLVLLFDNDEHGHGRILAGVLMAVAVFVRYAGLFALLGLNLVAAISIRRRQRTLRDWAPILAAANFPVAALLLWNQLRAGSWSGGHEVDQFDGFGALAEHAAVGLYSLFLGSVIKPWTFPMIVFVGLTAGAAVVAAPAFINVMKRSRSTPTTRTRTMVPIIVMTTYLAGILLADLTTSAAITARHIFPVLPIALVLAGVVVDRALASSDVSPRPVMALAVALPVLLAGLVGANAISLFERPEPAPHEKVADWLATTDDAGRTIGAVIEELVPPGEILFAAEGQATGHVLDRWVISPVGKDFSRVVWDEPTVRQTITNYRAGFVLVYPNQNIDASMPFIERLARGDVPAWLEIVASTSESVLFEVSP